MRIEPTPTGTLRGEGGEVLSYAVMRTARGITLALFLTSTVWLSWDLYPSADVWLGNLLIDVADGKIEGVAGYLTLFDRRLAPVSVMHPEHTQALVVLALETSLDGMVEVRWTLTADGARALGRALCDA